MLLMSVTLEVSKLSGWLKASAFCRVQRGHLSEGNAWHRGDAERGAGREAGRAAAQVARSREGPTQEAFLAERTWNIPTMVVTPEVSQLEMSSSKISRRGFPLSS